MNYFGSGRFHLEKFLKVYPCCYMTWQLVLCVAESCSVVCRYKFCLSDTCWNTFALFPANKAVRFAQRILGGHETSGLSVQFETQTLGLTLVGLPANILSFSLTHSLSHWLVCLFTGNLDHSFQELRLQQDDCFY